MDWVDRPQNYKDLYGILLLLRGSHLNTFPLKTLKLGWVAFHSLTFQLKCLGFRSNQYKKLVPVLSRFCNGLGRRCTASVSAVAITVIRVDFCRQMRFPAFNLQQLWMTTIKESPRPCWLFNEDKVSRTLFGPRILSTL